jgi:urease accessory protein
VHEAGGLRVRFPNADGGGLDAVIVNTAGGMTGGDRFDIDVSVGEGARLTVTSAAAEKIYRSLGADAEIAVGLNVGREGNLLWLPQETILFDQVRLRRTFEIDLAPGARLLMAESAIFGRSAMGETVGSGYFFDSRRVRIDGRLVFAETVRLDGDIARKLEKRAVARGAAAIASVIKVPGGDEDVAKVRALQQDFAGEVGASAWNGMAVARLVATDGAALRLDVIRVLCAFGGRLPRLWLQ